MALCVDLAAESNPHHQPSLITVTASLTSSTQWSDTAMATMPPDYAILKIHKTELFADFRSFSALTTDAATGYARLPSAGM